MDDAEKISLLKKLARGAIDRLEGLPQPVVRVCGPLTSGGFGYDENLKRFTLAEEALRQRGYTVFDYFDSSDDEEQIKAAGIDWEMVMQYYHEPILRADLLAGAFFMPKWEESNGSKWDHDFITKNTSATAEDIPETWITTSLAVHRPPNPFY